MNIITINMIVNITTLDGMFIDTRIKGKKNILDRANRSRM